MPDKNPAHRDILARVMDDGKQVLIPHLAEMLRREAIAEVAPPEERRRFWQRALTTEQEAQLWQQEMIRRGITELIPGSPAAIDIGLGISKQVYPDRWDMAPQEGRDHLSQQAAWSWKHARQGPPTESAPAMPNALSATEGV